MVSKKADEPLAPSEIFFTPTAQVKEKFNSPTQHMAASQLAAGACTFFFFPLDTIKTRFMSQDGTAARGHNNQLKYRHTFKALYDVVHNEGVANVFHGCGIAVCGSVTAWGLYMFIYKYINQFFSSRFEYLPNFDGNSNANRQKSPSFFYKLLSSSIANVVTSFFTSPIFLVKTRMQVENYQLLEGSKRMRNYNTFLGSISHIIRTSGYFSLWRGYSAQLILSVPHCFNLPIYDGIKSRILKKSNSNQLEMHQVLMCSAATKTIVLFLAHPAAVVKTRMQDQRCLLGEVKYRGLRDTFCTTMHREGVFRGLYRGMTPALFYALPRSITHFFLYEGILRLMAEV